MRFQTNVGERLRITSDGKVCINNDNALSDLHICTSGSSEEDGTLRIGGSSASLGFLFEYDQVGNTEAKITSNPTYTNTSASLKICVDGDANTNQLVLKGNGDIGINASSPGSKLTIYDADGDCLLLASHNYSGEARLGFTGNQGTGATLVNGSTCGAIGVTASAPGGAATGYMSIYTNAGDDLHEAVRIAADNTVHVAATGGDDVTYSLQTGRAQHSNGQAKTYSIGSLGYGQATFKIGLSDGNYKHAHFAVLLGGSTWSGGNGYSATVIANDTSSVTVSVNKQDGGYHITITNAGNSNTLFGAWQLEASQYTNVSKPTLTIS